MEKEDVLTALGTIGAVLAVLLAAASFTGRWPTDSNEYSSYTLQACAWLEGRLDLGKDYPWLELAVVDGKYYVSFPPFPSFVLLPFAAIFGKNTPDHLISLAFTVLGIVYAMKIYKRMKGNMECAAGAVLFLFLSNGYLFIAMRGWVWFLAQTLYFSLMLMAIDQALAGHEGCSAAALACAFGCRPMAIFYAPLLAVIAFRRWKIRHLDGCVLEWIKEKSLHLIPAVLIICIYMGLNAARFGSPFEFGHNYLPEFVREKQFDIRYVPDHFRQMFRLPKAGGKNGALIYDCFDWTAVWLLTPMSVLFLLAWAKAVWKGQKTFETMVLPILLAAHLMFLCCHRTLGGFQFGNRYLVDMLPILYYAILFWKPQGKGYAALFMSMGMMGFAVNLLGTVMAYHLAK